MSKIGKAGPNNAAILDTEKSVIEKGDAKILVIDEELSKKLKFIKQGEFVEKKGATTLQLVGDVIPIDKVEVVKKVTESLLKDYPYSTKELISEIKRNKPNIKEHEIYTIIKNNGIKDNLDYSAYNFRNKKQEDDYKVNKKVASGTPCIHNDNAIKLLIKLIENED